MDAYDRCTNLEKNIAFSVAIYGRGREIFRPATYIVSTPTCFDTSASPPGSLTLLLCWSYKTN